MSYEYKGLLKSATRDFLTGILQQDSETGEYLNLGEVEEKYSDISIELDLVYAQASKADEYEAKAEAYDDIRYAMEMQTAIGVSDEDTLIDIEHVIMSLIERMEGGGSDD